MDYILNTGNICLGVYFWNMEWNGNMEKLNMKKIYYIISYRWFKCTHVYHFLSSNVSIKVIN